MYYGRINGLICLQKIASTIRRKYCVLRKALRHWIITIISLATTTIILQ